MIDMAIVGAVVIGRNEGERLITCLTSLAKHVERIIYVDSGSTDDSQDAAKALGIDVLPLDMSIQFTAARGRNRGAQFLLNKYPNLKYIQFIDGDCELQESWLKNGLHFLEGDDSYAAVGGRCKERYPENSIYNTLCDIEWDTPIGDTDACGGNALFSVKAYNQVDGFDETLIAGEEPEMCFRLRSLGWRIRRLEAEMVLHDAAITRFSQWWSRAKRSGYAYASSYNLHGQSVERYKLKEVISILVWALILPSIILLLSLFYIGFLAGLLLYPLQISRLAIKSLSLDKGWKIAVLYASSIVLAKFPQFLGMVKFSFNKFKGVDGRLIEYK